MEYPEKTAGYNMVNNVPVFNEDNTLAEIEKTMEDAAHQFTTLDYIYLTKKDNTLVGVISIKNLMSMGIKV
jgi:magnesium transporter